MTAASDKKRIAQLEVKLVEAQRQLLVVERMRFEALKKSNVVQEARRDSSLLAAGVAHEFNNILGSLDGFAEWALDSKKTADYKEALGMVRVACARSLQITRALQGFAQPKEEQKCIFNLQEIEKDLKDVFKTKGSKIRSEVSLCDVNIYGSSLEIYEILLNLVLNAIDAVSSTKAPHIIVSAQKSDVNVFIQVEDNGPGVPEIYQEQIFKPFFTTKGVMGHVSSKDSNKKTSKHQNGGSGLGLYWSRALAEEHGGVLELLSSEKGTRFELRLPIV